jgi:hypothetical protein
MDKVQKYNSFNVWSMFCTCIVFVSILCMLYIVHCSTSSLLRSVECVSVSSVYLLAIMY